MCTQAAAGFDIQASVVARGLAYYVGTRRFSLLHPAECNSLSRVALRTTPRALSVVWLDVRRRWKRALSDHVPATSSFVRTAGATSKRMRCDDWRRGPNTPASVYGALPIHAEESGHGAAPRTRCIAYAAVRRGRVIRRGDTRAVVCVSRCGKGGYAGWDCSECRLVKQSHLSRYSRMRAIGVVAPHTYPSIAGKIGRFSFR